MFVLQNQGIIVIEYRVVFGKKDRKELKYGLQIM